jgi:hypothetical protein
MGTGGSAAVLTNDQYILGSESSPDQATSECTPMSDHSHSGSDVRRTDVFLESCVCRPNSVPLALKYNLRLLHFQPDDVFEVAEHLLP